MGIFKKGTIYCERNIGIYNGNSEKEVTTVITAVLAEVFKQNILYLVCEVKRKNCVFILMGHILN